MSEESPTVEAKPPAQAPLSTVFCADDADVIIRAAGTRDFRVHKSILSLVSPIFRDMFTLPQPPIDTFGTLPHVDVEESAETWENILRTIYPMSNPAIDDLDDLGSLLLAARKYEMQFVIDSHIRSFEGCGFLQQDPLHLYSIACACGFEDRAKYVARHAERQVVTRRSSAGSLRGLTVESYHQLVSFLTERDDEWFQTLDKASIPSNPSCTCKTLPKEDLYSKIKQNLKRPHLQIEGAYLKALEDQSRSRQMGCAATSCVVVDSEIKGFIERVIKEREDLCDKLMYEKQYVQWCQTALYLKFTSSIPHFPGSLGPKIIACPAYVVSFLAMRVAYPISASSPV